MNRRRFVALAGGAAAAALAADAWLVEPRRVQLTRHQVNARTSPEQRAVRFVQITDLHLQEVGRMHRRIAAQVNRIRPHFLVFTGDSVDRPDGLPTFAEFLGLLDRRTPGYAILGNWEHSAGVDLDGLAAAYRRANVRLLVNETAVHPVEGRGIAVAGLDDLVGGRPDVGRVLGGLPAADAHLLLAHCPEQRDRLWMPSQPKLATLPDPPPVSVPRITLMLSGHTHGGQVNLLGWAPMLPRGSGRYVRGWFRDAGGVPLYVSRGIGTTVVPVRFGSPPEVAVFTMWV
ncbi:MAG TPA: metallophosphoesterase [Longimicrobium sp.]|nr:metallophosphoesterase [Longimicrobium sp.]